MKLINPANIITLSRGVLSTIYLWKYKNEECLYTNSEVNTIKFFLTDYIPTLFLVSYIIYFISIKYKKRFIFQITIYLFIIILNTCFWKKNKLIYVIGLNYLLDIVDGLVARKLNLSSKYGEMLDNEVDRFVENSMFFFFTYKKILPSYFANISLFTSVLNTPLRFYLISKFPDKNLMDLTKLRITTFMVKHRFTRSIHGLLKFTMVSLYAHNMHEKTIFKYNIFIFFIIHLVKEFLMYFEHVFI